MSLICITETGHRYSPDTCPFLSGGVCQHAAKVNNSTPYKCQCLTSDTLPRSCDIRRLAARIIVTTVDPQDRGYIPILSLCLLGACVIIWRAVVIAVTMGS